MSDRSPHARPGHARLGRPCFDHVHLDHNAGAPLSAAAAEALREWLAGPSGNPSSVHFRGQRARVAVERAREQVAAAIGARPGELVFTSGATEANFLACHIARHRGGAPVSRAGAIVTTAVEHPSLSAAAAPRPGWRLERVGVDAFGRIDLEALAALAAGPGVRLVSALAVHHETGVLTPPDRVAAAAARGGALAHTDATQALGHVPVDVAGWGVDLASFSGHKIGALAGVGALFVRRGTAAQALFAGHQEGGLRGGTENVVGIVSFGAAAVEIPARLAAAPSVRALRDRLRRGLVAAIPGARVHGPEEPTEESGHVLNIAFAGVRGADLVLALDLEGICVSAGAACASGTVAPSPTLLAMPGADAAGAVRMSLGVSTTAAEIERTLAITAVVVARLRGLR